jgi:hypothetical protein
MNIAISETSVHLRITRLYIPEDGATKLRIKNEIQFIHENEH